MTPLADKAANKEGSETNYFLGRSQAFSPRLRDSQLPPELEFSQHALRPAQAWFWSGDRKSAEVLLSLRRDCQGEVVGRGSDPLQ